MLDHSFVMSALGLVYKVWRTENCGFRYLRNDTDFLENLAIIRLTGGFVEY